MNHGYKQGCLIAMFVIPVMTVLVALLCLNYITQENTEKITQLQEAEQEILSRYEEQSKEWDDSIALFNTIQARLDAIDSNEDFSPLADNHWNPDELEQQKQLHKEFFSENPDIVESIHTLAAMKQPVVKIDLETTFGAKSPHLSQMRRLSRILRTHARLNAEAQDTPMVLKDITAMIQLSKSFENEPTLISQLVRMALLSISFKSTPVILTPCSLNREQTEALLEELSDAHLRESFVKSHIIEVVNYNGVYQIIRGETGKDIKTIEAQYPGIVLEILITTDKYHLLRYHDQVLPLLSSPYYEARDEFELLNQKHEKTKLAPFLNIVVPAWAKAPVAQARHEAVVDLMRIGLSVELYKTEQGNFPATLDAIVEDLGGTVPVDPFTGDSFVYRLQDDSFILYSLGRNCIDDGGIHDINDKDLVWRGVKEEEKAPTDTNEHE